MKALKPLANHLSPDVSAGDAGASPAECHRHATGFDMIASVFINAERLESAIGRGVPDTLGSLVGIIPDYSYSYSEE